MMEIKDIVNVYVCKYNENSQFDGDDCIIVQDVNNNIRIMTFTSRREFEAGFISTWYTSRPLIHNIRTNDCMLTCYRRYRNPSVAVLDDIMVTYGKMRKGN